MAKKIPKSLRSQIHTFLCGYCLEETPIIRTRLVSGDSNNHQHFEKYHMWAKKNWTPKNGI